MHALSFAGTSVLGLLRNLRTDVKTFIRQELELATNEMLEKISCYGRNAASLAIGGVVAYTGLIVLLTGLGVLIGFAFQKLGLNLLLATFIGLAAIGLLVITVGTVILLKGIKTLSNASLKPQRTLDTIRHPKAGEETKVAASTSRKEKPKRPSHEIQKEVLATEDRIGAEVEEIVYRTSPARLKYKADRHVKTHAYGWSGIALVAGLIGSVFMGRHPRRR